MRVKDQNLVRSLPFFNGLEDDQLAELTRGALLQRFPKETQLFEQGDRPDFLHILIDGTVELYASSADGRETVIELVTPVDSFILAAVLTDTPYLMSSKVLEPAQILMLSAHRLRQQIMQQPKLALTMMASLAGHFRRMVRQVKDLKLRTSTQRLGAWLLHQVPETQENGEFDLRVSKQVLAGRLGMSPESLSRAFAALSEHGVHVRGRQIVVEDAGKLRMFCHPDILIDGDEKELCVLK
ncbi:CRP/FNR family transcriptional activator FtrB [Azospirillum fermentarium]|uniref:cyclic nucleotide-binding domain-containing protein n=1 Tax=Azospirillum fermentarium TaxID=1233114 RepID=UPI00222798ED|nr:cyclic nucleotide-binding domain-containing protein [Azospirillum fermentarium]MCW2248983.1 CRP/FNR family transcriptional activator FtrB [Azospirillum fermentarium]